MGYEASREEHTDIGDSRGDADLYTRVTLLGQLAGEELVQLGIENTVGDELAALGDGLGLCGTAVVMYPPSVSLILFPSNFGIRKT